MSSSHAITGIASNALLMTCQILVKSSDGSLYKVRALLDSASSASFVSERLAQCLNLHRSHHNLKISGVTGLSQQPPLQSIATFNVASTKFPDKKLTVSAIVVLRVTCVFNLYIMARIGTTFLVSCSPILTSELREKLTSYLVWTCTLMYS